MLSVFMTGNQTLLRC